MDSNNLLAAWPVIGPGVAGAIFGAGWWFWVDAVICSDAAIPFLHYLPGLFASFDALMFNCVNREDIGEGNYSPYDDSEWRVKLWLFISYVVSFVSLAGSVGFLVQDALTDRGPSAWTGIAGVLQCVFVLVSGLIYWTCHSAKKDTDAKREYDSGLLAETQLVYHGLLYYPSLKVWY